MPRRERFIVVRSIGAALYHQSRG